MSNPKIVLYGIDMETGEEVAMKVNPERGSLQVAEAGGKGLKAVEITMDEELDEPTEGIYIPERGDVEMRLEEMDEGESVVFKELQHGVVHPFRVVEVVSDNTEVTGILGIY